MSGTRQGALKRIENQRRIHGEDYFKQRMSNAGKRSGGNFASEKIGKDGLTGRQRAAINGKKGGSVTPTNFRNDPERAKKLSQEYWRNKKEASNEDPEISS